MALELRSLQQSILATVLVLTSSGLLKLAIHQLYPPPPLNIGGSDTEISVNRTSSKSKAVLGVVITAFLSLLALSLVFILGLWRAEEMICAQSLQPGDWPAFSVTTGHELESV